MIRIALLVAIAAFILAGCGGAVSVPTQLTLSPPAASALPNGQVQFTLVQSTRVDWSAPDGGTVANGLFTAPAATGSYRVVASDFLNPFVQATATVTVSNVAVSVTPASIVVAMGSVSPNVFTAFVTGSANTAVSWSADQAGAGLIVSGSNDGNGNARATFTAGTTPGLFSIRAIS